MGFKLFSVISTSYPSDGGVLSVVREDLWLRNLGAAVRVCIVTPCGWGWGGVEMTELGLGGGGNPCRGKECF